MTISHKHPSIFRLLSLSFVVYIEYQSQKMSHINSYPYGARQEPLLFEAPSRSSNGNVLKINRVDGASSGDNTENKYSEYSYHKIPRGTAPTHLQQIEKTTTVQRRTKNRVATSLVTIDSRDRIQTPRLVSNASYYLDADSLLFTAGSTDVTVILPKHNLQADNYITLSGVSAPLFIIDRAFEARNGSDFVRIEFINGHGLGDNLRLLDNLFVEISNVTTNLGSISANLLNGIHKVYLTCDYSNFPTVDRVSVNDVINLDTISLTTNSQFIYIRVPRSATSYYSDRNSPSDAPTNLNVVLQFQFISGIPLNYLNCGYPQSLITYDPYLRVKTVLDENRFTIRLRQEAAETVYGGGSIMQLTTILMADPGYIEPSRYAINLPVEYTNVVQVELVSMVIPYTGYLVISDESGKNNMLYWQFLDESSGEIYSAEIPRGNYNRETLASAIQTSMNSVANAPYKFSVTVNNETNRVSISLINSRRLYKSLIVEYTPATVQSPSAMGTTYAYIIEPDTRVIIGDQVTINYPNAIGSVPASALQKTYSVRSTKNVMFLEMDTLSEILMSNPTSENILLHDALKARKIAIIGAIQSLGYNVELSSVVIDNRGYPIVTSCPSFYQIDLGEYNEVSAQSNYVITAPAGQVFGSISTPAYFRMHFTATDTLGSILGFRNSGDANSVTNYSTTISNTDLYEYETKLGINMDLASRTTVDLIGDGYLYLCCPQLASMQSTSLKTGSNASSSGDGVSDIFAKIHLDGRRGHMLFNTHIFAPKIFDVPLTSLSSLDISIVTPSGRDYDFNGADHSFTLRISQIQSLPEDVAFNTKNGLLLEETPPY